MENKLKFLFILTYFYLNTSTDDYTKIIYTVIIIGIIYCNS